MTINAKLRKIFFNIILFTFTIFLLYATDLFVGIMYEKIAPEFGRKNLAMALNDTKGSTLLPRSPHPYLTYENTPNYYRNGIRQHNNFGYRQKNDINQLKNPLTLRILVLGGSTTYGQGVDDPKDAWPSLMQGLLNAALSNYKVEVINGGIPWGTSAELLNHYIFRDRYLKPDIVILHTGGNDGGPLKHNDYTPEYTHWRSIKAGGANSLRPGEKVLIENSNIMKLAYSVLYSRIGYSTPRAYIHTNSSAKLTNDEALRNVTNNEPSGFSRNLSLLLNIIKNDGAIPVYFHFYRPGKEMFSEKGKAALHKANKNTNFTKHFNTNQIMANKIESVARLITTQNDMEFVHIKSGEIPIEYFIDQCHLNHFGQMFKAKFISKKIFPYLKEMADKHFFLPMM